MPIDIDDLYLFLERKGFLRDILADTKKVLSATSNPTTYYWGHEENNDQIEYCYPTKIDYYYEDSLIMTKQGGTINFYENEETLLVTQMNEGEFKKIILSDPNLVLKIFKKYNITSEMLSDFMDKLNNWRKTFSAIAGKIQIDDEIKLTQEKIKATIKELENLSTNLTKLEQKRNEIELFIKEAEQSDYEQCNYCIKTH